MPFTAELGGKGPFIVFADADLDAAAEKAARHVRRRRAGLPRRHATARRGVRPRRVRRALRRSPPSATSSATAATPTTTDLAADPPRAPRARRRVRAAGTARTATRSSSAASDSRSDGLWYEPTLIEPKSNDSEIVQREVFGPVLDTPELRRRGRGGRPSRTPPPTDSRPWSSPPSEARAERLGTERSRGHDLGELLLGARPHRALRRCRHQRHRPRRRRLRARLLQRSEDATRSKKGPPMGEIVGAGLLAHVPTIVLTRRPASRAQQREREHALHRAARTAHARSSTC